MTGFYCGLQLQPLKWKSGFVFSEPGGLLCETVLCFVCNCLNCDLRLFCLSLSPLHYCFVLPQVMSETNTQVKWPSKLKIGAKSKKGDKLLHTHTYTHKRTHSLSAFTFSCFYVLLSEDQWTVLSQLIHEPVLWTLSSIFPQIHMWRWKGKDPMSWKPKRRF